MIHEAMPRVSGHRAAMRVFSSLAVRYASLSPAAHFHNRAGLVVAAGLPKSRYPRGGVCVGVVFLTGRPPSAPVVRHELRHVKQWERHGLLFPLLYWLAGRDPKRNRFEVEAGLVEGGYLHPPASSS